MLDFPGDENVWKIDDEYMMGESILCAPFIHNAFQRTVYFPEGVWYDFNNNKKYRGGKSYTIHMSPDEIPMFVKESATLPLAKPVAFISPSTVFDITCRVYGNSPATAQLFEDNSFDFGYESATYNWVDISENRDKISIARRGNFTQKLYKINSQMERIN